jgi:chloramphenicol-sensitive protein RarD
MNKGSLYALGAYVIWGFFPIYFKLLEQAPALQVVCHRIVWSFILLAILLSARKEWKTLRRAITGPKMLGLFMIASILLTVNWLTYVFGVQAGYIVETSLGYFINPLVSVLLGVVFLRERLRPLQWAAVSLAALGVLYLTLDYGYIPWIALVLALTFGLYGLAKKTSPLGSFYGLSLETGLMFIPCIGYLLFIQSQGTGVFGHSSALTNILLVFTGPATAVPLLMFGAAARKMNLTMLGLLQYIAPTLQFLIGVWVYHEPFTIANLVGFCIIWIALIVLWVEGYKQYRRINPSLKRQNKPVY